MDNSDIITKRLHISGLTPAITVSDLQKRLSTFGEVKSLSGFGLLDGVGNPRKFGYVDIETTKAKLSRCLNLLSGSTWKGAKLRIGEAKPDYRERLAAEHIQMEQMEPRPKKRRRVQATEAPDMSLVTAEKAKTLPGWKVTPTGRVIRPMKMRPQKPLGPTLDETNIKPNAPILKKRKKERAPDVRARRRLIDPIQWGSTQLRGVYLESHGLAVSTQLMMSDTQEQEESGSDSDSDSHVSATPIHKEISPLPVLPGLPVLNDTGTPDVYLPPSIVADSERQPDIPSENDIAEEKDRTLSLLNSLFTGDDWGGQENLSDIGEDVPQAAIFSGDNDDIEEVPMDVILNNHEDSVLPPVTAPTEESAPQKLKELFAPRHDDGGFSLLGHLDLDLELDEEAPFDLSVPTTASEPMSISMPIAVPTVISTDQEFSFVLDPKRPLFFPLPSSFAPLSGAGSGKQKDLFDVAREGGWHWEGFHRTESDVEIRERWEKEKGELTRIWKKRWREAGKARKRGGGAQDN